MTSQNNDIPKIPNPMGGGNPSSLISSANRDAGDTTDILLAEVQALRQEVAAMSQRRINLNSDVTGLFEVVSSAPTGTPRDVYDQIKVYTSGTTYRLYWYDWNAHAWHYATGT